MTIDRRRLLIGFGCVALAPAAALAREPPRFMRVVGPVFRKSEGGLAASDWLDLCIHTSRWHYDGGVDVAFTLIRHVPTRLTYHLSLDAAGEPEAWQVSTECCPAREENDPDDIVGHAARHVASRILARFTSMPDQCFYADYPADTDEGRLEPIFTDAPPIHVIPLPPGAV